MGGPSRAVDRLVFEKERYRGAGEAYVVAVLPFDNLLPRYGDLFVLLSSLGSGGAGEVVALRSSWLYEARLSSFG